MPILSQFYDKSTTKSALPAPGQSKLRYILEDSVPRKPVKPLNAMEKRLWPVWSNVSFFLVLNSTSSGPLLFLASGTRHTCLSSQGMVTRSPKTKRRYTERNTFNPCDPKHSSVDKFIERIWPYLYLQNSPLSHYVNKSYLSPSFRVFQYRGLSHSIHIFDNESLPKTRSLRLRLKSKSTLPDQFSLQYDCACIEGHNKEAGFRLA